ncbi:MAG: HD domain-containing protein [Thermoplasmata archaeon]|nr:HD domain-containing protein [Thermoplasmata archaeon]
MTYKIINDAVYGTIRIEGVILELMETLELQRLNAIRQLGLTYLVFPGANHSRIEHSLGAYHTAHRIAKTIGLEDKDRDIVCCAALLHDVGHGPFSHTLEVVINEILGVDHMEFTERIIMGEDDNVSGDERKEFSELKRIPDVLEAHGISPKDVASLIRGRESHLGDMVHGAMDVDQLDYLIRDSHYTGVAHGIIDIDRLIETTAVFKDQLVVDRKGLAAIEGLLVARALMYSSVYFHKTVRIAEMMMARAVEASVKASKDEISDLRKMVDAELMGWLLGKGSYQRTMALKIKYRKLFKKILELGEDELDDGKREKMKLLANSGERHELEKEICKAAKIPEGAVIVDLPLVELSISEPRLEKTDIRILDNDKISTFESLSPLGNALKTRKTSDWVLMVSVDQKYDENVKKVLKDVLFD